MCSCFGVSVLCASILLLVGLFPFGSHGSHSYTVNVPMFSRHPQTCHKTCGKAHVTFPFYIFAARGHLHAVCVHVLHDLDPLQDRTHIISEVHSVV